MTDLLAIARALPQGWTTSISTNGSLVTEEFAAKAAELKMTVQVSLDGAMATSCDSVRGVGAWERAIRAAEILVSNGVNTAINMVYHQGNLHELAEFIQLGEDLGVRMVRFLPFRYRGRGLHSGMTKVMHHEMVLKLREVLRTHPEWGDLVAQSFLGNILTIVRMCPRYKYCGTGTILLIDSNGDVFPCLNLAFPEFCAGNLRHQTFKDIWFRSPILNKLRSLCVETLNADCAQCFLRYMCGGGCRSEIYTLTSRMDLPAFYCASWKRAVIEACWTLDEFPQLHSTLARTRSQQVAQRELLTRDAAPLFVRECL